MKERFSGADSIMLYRPLGQDRPEEVLWALLRSLNFIPCSAFQSLFPLCIWHLGRASGPVSLHGGCTSQNTFNCKCQKPTQT